MYENIPEIAKYIKALSLDSSPHTIESYTRSIDKFLEFSKAKSIQEIEQYDSDFIIDFQKSLQDAGLENSSINTAIRPLKAMMNWLKEGKKVKNNPFVGVKALKVQRKEPAFMEYDEMDKLLSSTKSFENRTIFALYLYTGLREAELINLKIEDFDGTHILVHGKGNKIDKLALLPEISDMLYMYIDWRNKKYGNAQPYIFLSKYNKQYSPSGIWYKFKVALANSGFSEDRIEALHVHSMRHTFCANMYEIAHDDFTVQRAMRHSDRKTTALYSHLRDTELDKAMLNQRRNL